MTLSALFNHPAIQAFPSALIFISGVMIFIKSRRLRALITLQHDTAASRPMDTPSSETLTQQVHTLDPGLYAELRKNILLNLEDLHTLSPDALSTVTESIDLPSLSLALSRIQPTLRETLLKACSREKRLLIERRLKLLSKAPDSDVAAAERYLLAVAQKTLTQSQ